VLDAAATGTRWLGKAARGPGAGRDRLPEPNRHWLLPTVGFRV